MMRMRTAWITALVLAGLAFGASRAALTLVAQPDSSPQVLDSVRRFQEAGIRGDRAVLSQIFDASVSHFHPGSPYRFVGGERLVAEFEASSKTQFDMRFEMVDPQVRLVGNDVAVVTYYIVESWADKSGNRTSVKEKASEVWTKRDSRWVMLHSHYSAD